MAVAKCRTLIWCAFGVAVLLGGCGGCDREKNVGVSGEEVRITILFSSDGRARYTAEIPSKFADTFTLTSEPPMWLGGFLVSSLDITLDNERKLELRPEENFGEPLFTLISDVPASVQVLDSDVSDEGREYVFSPGRSTFPIPIRSPRPTD